MAQKQASQENNEEELWLGDDLVELGEASNDPEMPIKERMAMRHKIEDLLDRRRLQAQLSDYEGFDIDGAKTRHRH